MTDEPIDPFSIDNLRYSAAEYTHGEIEAKHELTAIQLRKPSAGNEWFRLRPGADHNWPVAMYARVSEKGDELYLVPGPFRRLFDESVLQPVQLRLVVNSVGTPFIWPMKMNTAPDARMANHYRALQAHLGGSRENVGQDEQVRLQLEGLSLRRRTRRSRRRAMARQDDA